MDRAEAENYGQTPPSQNFAAPGQGRALSTSYDFPSAHAVHVLGGIRQPKPIGAALSATYTNPLRLRFGEKEARLSHPDFPSNYESPLQEPQ
jgi:hypothetical protein